MADDDLPNTVPAIPSKQRPTPPSFEELLAFYYRCVERIDEILSEEARFVCQVSTGGIQVGTPEYSQGMNKINSLYQSLGGQVVMDEVFFHELKENK